MEKEKIEKIKEKILPILKKNDVVRASIFGSFARGEEKRGSDIDMLVELDKKHSLLDLIGIKLAIFSFQPNSYTLIPLLYSFIY